MAAQWWLLIPARAAGESTADQEQVNFITTGLTAAQGKTLLAGGQISDYGQQMVLQPGFSQPFSSEAAARAAQKPAANDPATQVKNDAGNAAKQALGIGSLGAGDLVRIGQVLLGLVLIAVAAARITGTANIVSTVVKARIP